MSRLTIQNLTKHFGGIRAIDRCSFSVKQNTIVALIGPNGAGKTTLFNIISGFYQPDAGTVTLNGEKLTGLQPHTIARKGLSRTFQLTRLFPKLTVMENLLLAKRRKCESLPHALFFGSPAEESRHYEEELLGFLRLVGLEKKKDALASRLSYGQQKLLEIARALAADAPLLLLDEPAAGVHPKLREELKRLLRELKQRGKTILFIEHDMPFVMGIADEVVVLDHGKEIAIGKPEQIRKDRKVLEAYLGA